MPMRNLDLDNVKSEELRGAIFEALQSGDNEGAVKAFVRMAENIQQNVIDEARSSIQVELSDREVLSRRGIEQLTIEERAYYREAAEKGGFDKVDVVMPTTIFDRVFEDLIKEHPLLNEIVFENTTGATEWITRTSECEGAWWGDLTDEIKKKLKAGFNKIKTDTYKLSAYMPVAKSMLDLGPEWLDRYVRAVLSESLSIGLEKAIVAGTGKNEPIGMIKNLKGSVVEGVYPDKDLVELTDLTPETLGKVIMSPLTKNGTRAVPSVLMVVNPVDYWEKIFPATTVLTANGNYVYGVLPIPAKVIQSVAIPKGKMSAGIGKDYFLGIASNSKMEYSDHYKFLEDVRTYIIKQFATGKPKDNDSYLYLDISKLSIKPVKAK